MKLIFASANRHKLAEVSRIFGPSYQIILPQDLGLDEDIPETGDTLAANSLQKAQFVWDRFHLPCFSDDTGLEVDALGGAPGVYSARYAGDPRSSARNIEKLLREMEGICTEKRTARFRCVVTLITDGQVAAFDGVCEGRIGLSPVCQEGFGYDPVFIPEGFDCTMSELSLDVKNTLSHRGKAMKQLVCHLSQHHG